MENMNMLDHFSSIIEEDLKKQLKKMVRDGEQYHPFAGKALRSLEEYLLRQGRRIASSSTLIVYNGYTSQIDDRIITAGSGIELYRHSILAHDDIADAEMFRRGGRTLHKLFEEGYDEHFGIGTAIFAGNILYSLSLETMLQSSFDDDKQKEVVDLLASGYKDVNESQILDLLFEYKTPTIEEWSAMASKRAASLFKTSMLAGAILASAPKGDLTLLKDASRHIGYAFDIQDDIIDTFADQEEYGRVPGGDLLKRKKPLHIILAAQREPSIASLIEGHAEVAELDISRIRKLIRDCGALDEAKSISRQHGKEAKELILRTEMNQDAKGSLIALIDYVEESLDWYR